MLLPYQVSLESLANASAISGESGKHCCTTFNFSTVASRSFLFYSFHTFSNHTNTSFFFIANPWLLDISLGYTFEDGQSTKTVPGVGEYSINPDGSITFTPEKQYVGTPDPVTVKRVDKNGTEVTATYTPTVTKVTPTSTNATSTGPQGVPQTGP
ncbi:hypothetical protein V470_10950 [Streptococcus sp. VT 162]|nr:hypothetical protein V470_10950 [Streptococcus sp. VT 162]